MPDDWIDALEHALLKQRCEDLEAEVARLQARLDAYQKEARERQENEEP